MGQKAAVEATLKRLEELRATFEWDAHSEEIDMLIDTLVSEGEYPETTTIMQKFGYTHRKMMESWGVDWHKWHEPLNCPKCNADLRDQESGPPFKREIGWYDHDMTVCWICPDCGKAFNRFGPEHGDLHLSYHQLNIISEQWAAAKKGEDPRSESTYWATSEKVG